MINDSVLFVLLNVVNIFWNWFVIMFGIFELVWKVVKFLVDRIFNIGLYIVLIILFLFILKN